MEIKTMKKIAIEKLWGMVNRIDSKEKAIIAEAFLRECDLSSEDFDELMMAVAEQYRFFNEIEKDTCLKPQYRRYAH